MADDDSDSGEGLSIRAVSDLLGIPTTTIRSWERRYELAQTARTAGGHRRYTPTAIADLCLMRDEISRGRRPAEAAVLVRDRADPAEPYRSFTTAFVDAAQSRNPARLDGLLDRCRDQVGLEETISRVILPGMREIGVTWQLRRGAATQEHVATPVVRGWLKKVLDAGPVPLRQTIVLSAGPGDLHTVGLEAMEVLLGQRGWACHLLGERIPAPDLTAAINRTGAAATIVVSHIASHRRATVTALRAADRTSTRLFYAGTAFLAPSTRRGVPGRYLGENLIGAVDIVSGALQAPPPG